LLGSDHQSLAGVAEDSGAMPEHGRTPHHRELLMCEVMSLPNY